MASRPLKQIPVEEIFHNEVPDAVLKRDIATLYIMKNPPQVELVEWLQAKKFPLPPRWDRYHCDDWREAWRRKRNLVKAFLSRIAIQLRRNGYQVGGHK